jgi:ABC-type branched-subunit amino acid transport system substrate-binding protein
VRLQLNHNEDLTLKPFIKFALLAIAATALQTPVWAQIKIGQTAGYSGAAASSVKETVAGAHLYLDHINAQGGINGQKIELVSLDDKFDPALAAENAKKLIADSKVMALFLTRGTPHTEAIMPLLSTAGITLIAPSTGAMSLHSPVHPWVFNVRATYQREAEHLTRHLSVPGAHTVAVIQVNDSFGADVAPGVLKVFKELGKEPAAYELFDRKNPDFTAIATKVAAAKPLSVIFIGTGSTVAEGVKALRAAGSKATIATLSNNASSGFIKQMGENAANMIVSQVFPSPRSYKVAMAAEASQLAERKKIAEVTPQMLEGFAAAKVLVAALKRCGNDISRSNIKKALETFNKVDIGGLEVSFSPTDHTGLRFSELSIVSAEGVFRR